MRHLLYAYIGIICAALAALLLLNLGGPEEPGPVQPGRSLQIAYAAYDTEYAAEDLLWLAEHADLLIMHQSLSDSVPSLRNSNPDIILLQYKFSGITDEDRIGHSASGFDYVSQRHDEWFLKDLSGKRVSDDYDAYSRQHSFYMDPGNSAWTDYAAQDYINTAAQWDGIFLDVLPLEVNQVSESGLAKYSSDSAYRSEVIRYVYSLHSKLNSAGLLLIVNGAAFIYQDPYYLPGGNYWQLFLDQSDGALEESFASAHWWGDSWQPYERWLQQIEAMEYAGQHDKHYIAFSHNRGLNRKDAIYNLASFLLAAHDKAYFYNMGLEKYRIENFREDYAAFHDIYNIDLGEPKGPRYQEGRFWVREFEKGTVRVNPTQKTAEIVSEKVRLQG
jgi:hypothetical protein